MSRIAIFILLLGFTSMRALGYEQRATVSQLQVHPSKAITGAAEYDFSGTIIFEHSMDDFKRTGDSSERVYVLNIKFKNGNKLVTVNRGLENRYADDAGVLVLAREQKLSMTDVNNYEFTFSVPLSAFNLAEGTYGLAPEITLVDGQSYKSILRKTKQEPVTVTILPVEKIRVWVKHILVDSLDAQGQLWDYFVVNPIESNPDLVWSLKYAGKTYFSSKMVKNVFEYWDNDKRETYDLTISKGDSIDIEVKDVDDLTPDDIIGNVIVRPSDPKYQNEAVATAKSGQIKIIEYSLLVSH